MASPIGSILRHALRPPGLYNCITFPTHERYQSNLAGCNSNFYMLQGTPGVKGNGWITSYADMPQNHILLEKKDNPLESLPPWINYDFILAQHRFGQAQTALQLGQHLNLPVIILEHTTVTSPQLEQAVPKLREIRGDVNVFISESSARAWGWDLNDGSVVITHHGVDSQLFKPNPMIQRQNKVLSIVNDWVNRGQILGWDTFQNVVLKNNLPFQILGDNPGISSPAKNVYELVDNYNKASVFYNTSRFSPIPSTLLEAMSCSLPVVSTDNYLISEIVINGYNGYKTNSEAEQFKHLQRLLADKDEREELGKNARQTIIDKFPLDKFVENWNKVFDKVANK